MLVQRQLPYLPAISRYSVFGKACHNQFFLFFGCWLSEFPGLPFVSLFLLVKYSLMELLIPPPPPYAPDVPFQSHVPPQIAAQPPAPVQQPAHDFADDIGLVNRAVVQYKDALILWIWVHFR